MVEHWTFVFAVLEGEEILDVFVQSVYSAMPYFSVGFRHGNIDFLDGVLVIYSITR